MTPQELVKRVKAWYTVGAMQLARTEPGYEAIGRETLPIWADSLADVGKDGFTLRDWYMMALDVTTAIRDYVQAPSEVLAAVDEGTGVIKTIPLGPGPIRVTNPTLISGRVGAGLGVAALLGLLYVVSR